jgi:3-methyl-2-oxobutanoate hydroxymethyltransferase
MTVEEIRKLKGVRKVTMLTAYDYSTGSLVDKAGIDIVLVGDSLANVVLGLESTKQVGMEEMLHHTKAVRRGVTNALLVGDMPFESFQTHPEQAVANARRFVDEAGCAAVKLEWFDRCPEVTEAVVKAGIPVVGHIGLTPQTADKLGGFKVQGKDAERAAELIRQAEVLQQKGCFALVLECVPAALAGLITRKVSILTIGIGGGPECDGQVLVINDMLGLFERYTPKFVKKYADLSAEILKAVGQYKEDVLSGRFPAKEHCFTMREEELKKLGL